VEPEVAIFDGHITAMFNINLIFILQYEFTKVMSDQKQMLRVALSRD
jgi:hypothetical protein